MKTSARTAILVTAALLVTGGATAQQYSYDAQRYGGVSTITSIDSRATVFPHALSFMARRGASWPSLTRMAI